MSNPEAIIALMGPTGTGKSTFINLLTGDKNIRVGHDIASQTFDVNTARHMVADHLVTFVDTPGFDDSREGVTDSDILEKITKFLRDTGSGSPRINGIIYLHRISDPRMGGMARKNLRMFRELCGDDNLKNVRIVTTNWEHVKQEDGKCREAQLAKGPFGPIIECGAEMLAHDGGLDSARSIVSQIVQMAPVKLKIQKELDDGRVLGDTSAGAVILEEMKEMQKKHNQEMEDLMKELEEVPTTDEDLKAELAKECQKLEAMMKLAERGHNRLLGPAPEVIEGVREISKGNQNAAEAKPDKTYNLKPDEDRTLGDAAAIVRILEENQKKHEQGMAELMKVMDEASTTHNEGRADYAEENTRGYDGKRFKPNKKTLGRDKKSKWTTKAPRSHSETSFDDCESAGVTPFAHVAASVGDAYKTMKYILGCLPRE